MILRSQQLKAGIYQIKVGESAQQFLYRVVDGDVLVESFRIIPGTTKEQISKNLSDAPYLNYEPTDWQTIEGIHQSAEGLLLADTYYYDAGTSSKHILEQAYQHLNQLLEESWRQRRSRSKSIDVHDDGLILRSHHGSI